MVFQRCLYSSGGVLSDFKKRGFFPRVSSGVYWVIWVNFGFTYSILPLISVIIIATGLCSTAYDNLCFSSASASAMQLKLRARSPISSLWGMLTRYSRSPSINFSAAAFKVSIGFTIEKAKEMPIPTTATAQTIHIVNAIKPSVFKGANASALSISARTIQLYSVIYADAPTTVTFR